MIATTSLLDYLKKEDSLMKECDRNVDRQVSLLRTIDDSEDYPSIYSIPKDELQKYKERRIIMHPSIAEVQIKQVRGYFEVYVNGEFFCSTDSYTEAVNELYEAYGL